MLQKEDFESKNSILKILIRKVCCRAQLLHLALIQGLSIEAITVSVFISRENLFSAYISELLNQLYLSVLLPYWPYQDIKLVIFGGILGSVTNETKSETFHKTESNTLSRSICLTFCENDFLQDGTRDLFQ